MPLLSVTFLTLFILVYTCTFTDTKSSVPVALATAFVLTETNIASSSEKLTSVKIALGTDMSKAGVVSLAVRVFATVLVDCISKFLAKTSVSESYFTTASNRTDTSGIALCIC